LDLSYEALSYNVSQRDLIVTPHSQHD
jgi:hypothetical protein